ncbi:hypothetical protein [Pandoraea anhela]|uniref:Halovibrin n=1 Tax=Pandoraea anhela TaxID=2508295 RepID=A0A5E4RS54_9BURK|nr:hypothetical protein [Pandoraea anhela]VVD64889.1 hypothetical protein PAN31108_00302 [Pandoraea anhela]
MAIPTWRAALAAWTRFIALARVPMRGRGKILTNRRRTLRVGRVGRIVLTCLGAALAMRAAPADALTGADVAQLVNQRYASRVEKCALDRPLWMCSGVIVRPLSGGASQHFAAPTASETQTQSVNLAFVRGDLRASSLGATAGLILEDGFTAVASQKSYDVRCVYPLSVEPTATSGAKGCDLPGGAASAPPDLSSCATHGVTDAAAWVDHFNASAQSVLKQCSMNALAAKSFYAAMQAHEQAPAPFGQTTMSLLVAAWNPALPATIPIQALYYDTGSAGQLLQAQRYQMQFYAATQVWLPILRVTFVPGQGATFGYDETEQLDEGFRVVERLTKRYLDTSPDCNAGTKAAYYCDGVLIRMVAVQYMPVWNPRADYYKRDGISFTYLRADAKVGAVATWTGGTGFIMKEFNAPAGHPLTLKCSFPTDAGTGGRSESCFSSATDKRFCDELGVTSYAIWVARYGAGGIGLHCPFRPDPAGFQLSITIRRDYPNIIMLGYPHNEITLKPWPSDIPGQLPLEAFVVVGSAFAGGRVMQQGYFDATGRFLPIVRVNVTAAATQVFTYVPADQISAN